MIAFAIGLVAVGAILALFTFIENHSPNDIEDIAFTIIGFVFAIFIIWFFGHLLLFLWEVLP